MRKAFDSSVSVSDAAIMVVTWRPMGVEKRSAIVRNWCRSAPIAEVRARPGTSSASPSMRAAMATACRSGHHR